VPLLRSNLSQPEDQLATHVYSYSICNTLVNSCMQPFCSCILLHTNSCTHSCVRAMCWRHSSQLVLLCLSFLLQAMDYANQKLPAKAGVPMPRIFAGEFYFDMR
jgi:hypothetical protein